MSKKSQVWDFFKKEDNNYCKCSLCGRKYKSGGGTTNLKNHLDHKHPTWKNKTPLPSSPPKKARIDSKSDNDEIKSSASVCEDEKEETESYTSDATFTQSTDTDSEIQSPCTNFIQPSIKKLFRFQRSYEPGETRESSITQALIYMVCKDNLPLSCTEKEGMKTFLKTTVPLYPIPSRKSITKEIESKYIALKTLASKKLNTVKYIALTTDIATVMNATRSFIVLTSHFIDEEEGNMNSMCLGIKNLTPHHTSINICEDLRQMIETWKIDKHNVISVTTDNGKNIVGGVKMLFSEQNIHVSCFAHNINLVVSKALGAVNDIVLIIEKVKTIVAYFKHSNVAQDELRTEQRKEGKGDSTFLYLKQEVATRWNSTLYCLERFKLLSGHVAKILLSHGLKNAPSMLNPGEMAVIEECINLLQPFQEATNEISGEKYISGSLVIPLINGVQLSLERINVALPLTQNLKTELISQIKKRLIPLEENPLLAATLLDPRFKKIHFGSIINGANAVNQVKKEVRKELKLQGTVSPPVNSTIPAAESTSGINIWNVHEEIAAKTLPDLENEQLEGLPTELKLYFNQPLLAKNRDPIQYWTDSKNAFPATYQVAIKYLTILGASERVVSTLNNVASNNRSRLTPEHTNQLVFLGSLDSSFWKI